MRLIDADEIVKVAEHAFHEWTLAMVGADDTRKVDEVFKKQYLCKVVKAVAENCPTVDAVVLPCNVGDTVYQADASRIYPVTIKKLIYDAGHIAFDEEAIGKSIFLTPEEAERKMNDA